MWWQGRHADDSAMRRGAELAVGMCPVASGLGWLVSRGGSRLESGGVIDPAWSVASGLWAGGTFYEFMKGFFGWHREAEWIRLITYVACFIPVMHISLRAGGPTVRR